MKSIHYKQMLLIFHFFFVYVIKVCCSDLGVFKDENTLEMLRSVGRGADERVQPIGA